MYLISSALSKHRDLFFWKTERPRDGGAFPGASKKQKLHMIIVKNICEYFKFAKFWNVKLPTKESCRSQVFNRKDRCRYSRKRGTYCWKYCVWNRNFDEFPSEEEEAVGDKPAGDRLLDRGQAVQHIGAAADWQIYKILQILQTFGGLVLGCIKTKFCKKICVWQHVASIRLHRCNPNISAKNRFWKI